MTYHLTPEEFDALPGKIHSSQAKLTHEGVEFTYMFDKEGDLIGFSLELPEEAGDLEL